MHPHTGKVATFILRARTHTRIKMSRSDEQKKIYDFGCSFYLRVFAIIQHNHRQPYYHLFNESTYSIICKNKM